MKDIKCPLCRTTYTLSTYGIPEQGCVAYSFECEKCRYELSRYKTLDGAVSSAKKFISKFPPIMRLNQGDNIKVRFTDGIGTVLYTDLEQGKIFFQDVYGDGSYCHPDFVYQWPWELEQKGGAEQ